VLLALVLNLFLTEVQPATCHDVPSCRTAALEAKERKDFEAFHDLAWLTYRKGKPDDPELMLLLARAQSLSGRPGDAIVMLERLTARGIATDAATSEDFESVRALSRWGGVAPSGAAAVAPSREAPPAPSRDAKPAPGGEAKPAPSREAAKAAPRDPSAPLSFTTLLSPTALAYDAVSKRYLIADREAKRIAVIDESSGHVSTLAGALARLGEINGIAIDSRQGDLWVVTSAEEGISLSRLQLISGRELGAARITGVKAPVTGVAFVRGLGVVVSDEQGDIWRVSASGKSVKLGSLEYVPKGIAADAEGTLYIAAGSRRLARYSASPFRRLGIIDLDDALPGSTFAVTGDRIHLMVSAGGAYEIRTIKK
jgi:sugar lactone lactonase YvrE